MKCTSTLKKKINENREGFIDPRMGVVHYAPTNEDEDSFQVS